MTEAPWEAPDELTLDHVEESIAEQESTAIVALIARGSARAAASWRDPDDVARYADELRATVLGNVRDLAAAALARRKTDGGRVTSSTVAPELRLMGDAHDALAAVADSIKAGALEARKIAGEIVLDVEPDAELRTATVRVGDGKGGDLKVTRTQATKVEADVDAIVDVLVANLAADAMSSGEIKGGTPELPSYAAGARAAIAALRALVGPLAWKSTALDQLAKSLEDREEYDLAIRLGHAYGRVAQGAARTTIERTERAKR